MIITPQNYESPECKEIRIRPASLLCGSCVAQDYEQLVEDNQNIF